MILSQKKIGAENLYTAVEGLNRTLHIPSCLKEVIADEAVFTEKLDEMAALAKADGCTKNKSGNSGGGRI